MKLGRILPLSLCFAVATCGVVAVVSTSEETSREFAAHEFALLRGEYQTRRSQSARYRIELFRRLQSSLGNAEMTPGMAGSVAEFCEEVLLSPEELIEVKNEAKLALQALERYRPAPEANRAPASVATAKD